MPPITILKSELLVLEQKIKLQEGIIQNQQKIIELMKDALISVGVPFDRIQKPTGGGING